MKTEPADTTASDTKAADLTARGSNQRGLRAYNERLVLTLIRQNGALAKAAIARMTGLSAQTVSVIMRALESDGLLRKEDPVRGKVGQPSVPMSLAPTGAYFLGLKVGRRSLDLVLTDFLGQIVGRVGQAHDYPTPDSVLAFADDAIDRLADLLPAADRGRIAGLGIAIPFRMWEWAEVLGADPDEMQAWASETIAADLARERDFPVYQSNDTSAACGAELVFGDQPGPRDFLYLFVGFFVGGGLVLDSVLYTGPSGNAAAVGSIPIGYGPDGPVQLVDVASLATLDTLLQNAGHSGDIVRHSPQGWDLPRDVRDAWLTQAADGMAQAIVSSACLIDFDTVLIDGSLPDDIRTDLVQRTAARLSAFGVPGIRLPEIRTGTIGSDARSLGAASLPLSHRFLADRTTF